MTAKISVAIAALALVVSGLSATATVYLQTVSLQTTSKTNGVLGGTNLCFTWARYVEDLREKHVPLKEIDRRVAYLMQPFDTDDEVRPAATHAQGCASARGMFGKTSKTGSVP
jgi:hypothetical protein